MSKRLRELEKQLRALTEEVTRLRPENLELRQENLRLKARVAQLEEREGPELPKYVQAAFQRSAIACAAAAKNRLRKEAWRPARAPGTSARTGARDRRG